MFLAHLRQQLAAHKALPGHVEMLNMLARSVGHRNFQQLRAQAEAHARLSEPPPAEEPVDFRRLERLARSYDSEGRLRRWPARHANSTSATYALMTRPARTVWRPPSPARRWKRVKKGCAAWRGYRRRTWY